MVNGQEMSVQCPAGAAPGSTIQINVGAPAQTQPHGAHAAHPQQHVAPPPNLNDPSAVFDMIDRDRSGHITAKELQQVRLKYISMLKILRCSGAVNL